MADVSVQDISALVQQTSGVNGGRPCLAGTGFSVLQVAALFNEGSTPEEIVAEYPFLDLARVYAGVTYYLANRAAIDAELAAEAERFERAAASLPRNRD